VELISLPAKIPPSAFLTNTFFPKNGYISMIFTKINKKVAPCWTEHLTQAVPVCGIVTNLKQRQHKDNHLTDHIP
jgi:hypothetical protein